MRKFILSFLLIISAYFSYAQLNVNSVTIRILKATFDINETEPKETKYIYEEFPVRITEDFMIINDDLYKVVLIVKKRFTNVFKIYYIEENNNDLGDYPEAIHSVEYYSVEKTLKKVIVQGDETVYINYYLN